MTKSFYILGEIVGSTGERWMAEDLCPQAFKRFASGLERGDELELHINSVGGDVFAGFTIAQIIKDLSDKGIPTTAVVDGLAASIASVIACACDKIKMYESSFMMLHNCWSVVQGNADALRKEAEMMDKIDSAIRTFYHKHFDLTDNELEKAMDAETWISGEEVGEWKLDCEVIPSEKQYKIAACLNKMNFNKIPKALRTIMENEKIENTASEMANEKPVDETPVAPVEEKPVEEPKLDEEEVKAVEEQIDEQIEKDASTGEERITLVKPTPEALEKALEKCSFSVVTKAEADKRVSGMQSTMAKKMDAMKKEYDAKILDFENQLKTKDEELAKAKAEATSLEQRLEVANKELSEKTSALEEKSNALATLNAGVLTPTETKESWRNLKGQKFLDYVNAHKKELSK